MDLLTKKISRVKQWDKEDIAKGFSKRLFGDKAYKFVRRKLTNDKNPTIPFVVNCLEVKQSQNGMRKKIVTTQDLEVGDVLAIKEPFYTASFNKHEFFHQSDAEEDIVFKRCYHCHKDNFLDLIKCNECERVMFCSIKCRRKSFQMYHKYECFISRIVQTDLLRAMRTFFYALYLFNHEIQDLKAFILSRGRERKTIFDFNWRKLNGIQRERNLFLCYDFLVPSKLCDEQKPFYLIFKQVRSKIIGHPTYSNNL
ncbi:unnamed protein product [Diamesa hyperborea]